MTHYILMKLVPGADVEKARGVVAKAYDRLEKELPYFNNPEVYAGCVERDINADLLAKVDLDSAEDLPKYLNHPIHVEMAKYMDSIMDKRMAFDHQ